jgi:hypothetical protein
MQGSITFVSAAVGLQFVTKANQDATVQNFWIAEGMMEEYSRHMHPVTTLQKT